MIFDLLSKIFLGFGFLILGILFILTVTVGTIMFKAFDLYLEAKGYNHNHESNIIYPNYNK